MTRFAIPWGRRGSSILGVVAVVIMASLVLYACFFANPAISDEDPRSRPRPSPREEKHEAVVRLAAPGRIEGLSEMVNVGTGIDGVLSEVLVVEGQDVRAGQTVARVACSDAEAEVEAVSSAREMSRQSRARLLRGYREEERREASAESTRAEAVLKQARLQFDRIRRVAESGHVARETLDRASSDREVAQAALQATRARQDAVNAAPLPEEIARADAEIEAAEARLRIARAKLDKCTVKAPLSGTVLRRYMKAGETVSTVFPQPIIGIMDLSRERVRAEVDERDIGQIYLGQRVMVSADAFPDHRFEGQVASIGHMMGRKKVRTGDPAEKSDRDVLEVLIDLYERDTQLVIGLRVTVQFKGPGHSS